MSKQDNFCRKCKVNPVEQIDDWKSDYCRACNNIFINLNNNRREWDHYHPNEPIPKSELEKK